MTRKLSTICAAILAAMSTGAFAGTPINASELPKAAQTFLAKYFAGDTVRKAEKDQGFRGMEYDVDLQSGAEVDFDSDGDWKEVKAAHGKAVPDAIVPKGIAQYVKKNFPDLVIIELQRRRNTYEVELSNGTEMYLNADGTPAQARRGKGNRGPRN